MSVVSARRLASAWPACPACSRAPRPTVGGSAVAAVNEAGAGMARLDDWLLDGAARTARLGIATVGPANNWLLGVEGFSNDGFDAEVTGPAAVRLWSESFEVRPPAARFERSYAVKPRRITPELSVPYITDPLSGLCSRPMPWPSSCVMTV